MGKFINRIKQKQTLVLLAIFIFALIVRIIYLTQRSLWFDESFSWRIIQFPFPEFLKRASEDVHPILYYLFLKAWMNFLGIFKISLSLFWLRFPSVIFSVGTIFATYLAASSLYKSRWVATTSALLLSVSFFQIQYAWEARMYSLGTFLLPLAIYFLSKTLKSHNGKKIWQYGALFGITVGCLLHTHYFLIFSVFPFFIFGVIYWIFKKNKGANNFSSTHFKALTFGFGLSLLIFLPWLPIFFRQISQVQNDFWIPVMSAWSIPNTIHKILIGNIYDPSHSQAIISMVGFIIILAVPVFFGKKLPDYLLTTMVITPFVFSWIISHNTSIYLDRYFIFTAIPFFILLSRTISFLKRPKTVVVLIIFIFFSFQLISFWNKLDFPNHPGAIGASNYIKKHTDNNEPILISTEYVYFPMLYHLGGYSPKLLNQFNENQNLSGNPIITNFDLADNNALEKGYKKITVVDTTGFSTPILSLPPNYKLISETSFPEVYGYQGDIVVRQYELTI